MCAKEMFELLGFKFKKNNFIITYYQEFTYRDEDSYTLAIDFDLLKKTCFSDFSINFDLLKAINKQFEELGWFDD